MAQDVLGISRRRWKNLGNENVCYYKRKEYTGIGARLKEKVTSFFVRNDVKKANGHERKKENAEKTTFSEEPPFEVPCYCK